MVPGRLNAPVAIAGGRQDSYPIISDRLPLTAAAHAHEFLEQSAVTGQLVLQCSNGTPEFGL
jgi:hypothetical protein